MTVKYFLALLALGCIGAYFTWLNNFKSRQANAAAVFRACFAEALSNLKNTDICPYDILNPAFHAHESSVLEFKRYLIIKRKAFMNSWLLYAYHPEEHRIPFLEQYSSRGTSISERKQRRALAIKRIEHLLSFANQA